MILLVLLRHVAICAWRSLSCAAGIHEPPEGRQHARAWVCIWCHTPHAGCSP